MGVYWTETMDGQADRRRAALAQLQARLRRRAYWGPEGLAWAYVRVGAYLVIIGSAPPAAVTLIDWLLGL